MTETQFLAPAVQPDEDELDRSLRPRKLDEFVGQERIKEQLAIALEATRSRGEALVELGYSVVQAEQALARVDPDLPVEEQVREALKEAA